MNKFEDITPNEIKTSALLSDNAITWAIDNLEYLNKAMRLFGSSMKTEKGLKQKVETIILYLQPANKVSRKTICAAAKMAGCETPCLISSGMLGLTTGQKAATKRTILMLLRPEWFDAKLLKEIDSRAKSAFRKNYGFSVRLNGTSDLDFSRIISQRPTLQFYDYSKLYKRVNENTLPNYHLTFSGSMYSKQSIRALEAAVASELNIAVAYNTKNLKSDPLKIPAELASFDETDLRFKDAAKTLGTLTRKGSSKAQREIDNVEFSFFVTEQNQDKFNNIIARAA